MAEGPPSASIRLRGGGSRGLLERHICLRGLPRRYDYPARYWLRLTGAVEIPQVLNLALSCVPAQSQREA